MCRGLGAGAEGVSGVPATVGPGQGRRMGTPPSERGSHLLRGLGASLELEGQRRGGQVMPSAVNWGPEDWGAR